MSALPPKADISDSDRHVRFVPKADIVCLALNNGLIRSASGSTQPALPSKLWRGTLMFVFARREETPSADFLNRKHWFHRAIPGASDATTGLGRSSAGA